MYISHSTKLKNKYTPINKNIFLVKIKILYTVYIQFEFFIIVIIIILFLRAPFMAA